MAGVNKVIIIGHLGANPELRTVSNGNTVARLSVATSENWTDREGQRHERTEWHRVVVWGKQAEICGKFLVKGKQVYVEGRLQTRSWEDQNNQKKYTTEVVANNIQFLGQANPDAGSGAYTSSYQREDKKKSYTPSHESHNPTTTAEAQTKSGLEGTTTYSSTARADSSTTKTSSLADESSTTFDKSEEIPF